LGATEHQRFFASLRMTPLIGSGLVDGFRSKVDEHPRKQPEFNPHKALIIRYLCIRLAGGMGLCYAIISQPVERL